MKITKIKQNGFTIIESLIILVIVGVVSFGIWRVVDTRRSDNQPNVVAHQQVLPDSLSDLKPTDEILSLATAEIGTRQILAVELEQEDEGLVYSVKLSDGTVLVFNARTGAKVQLNNPDNPEIDNDKPLPAAFKPAITLQAAVQTAKEKRPSKTVSKVKLELEGGIVVFSVRFSDGGRVDVDALTGDTLRLREPGRPEVKLRDDDNDIDDDGDNNGVDIDDDNDSINDSNDSDDENDGLADDEDPDDDNDGINDDEDDNSSSDGSGSSNSGNNSGSGRN